MCFVLTNLVIYKNESGLKTRMLILSSFVIVFALFMFFNITRL